MGGSIPNVGTGIGSIGINFAVSHTTSVGYLYNLVFLCTSDRAISKNETLKNL